MKNRRISPYLLVMISFLGGILVGGFLLSTPFAQKSGAWGNYASNVFMATSAVCVTGFDCFPEGLANTYTLFGQIVELVLMQIGGLGMITILVFFITLFHKNISFKDRHYISQATGSTTIPHVVSFVRKILLVTLIIETIGFCLGIPAFIDLYGNTPQAYFTSLFHAVSAFNNAGLDVFGGNTSLMRIAGSAMSRMSDWAYYYLTSYTMILIILGGLSYIALIEIFSFKKRPHQWTAHTKICLLMTAGLVIGGTLLIFLTNGIYNSSGYPISFYDSLFLSVTSRTAGYSTYDPTHLNIVGRVINWVLMFIGGGPLGTASGIKTTTIFIIFLAMFSFFRGRKVKAFNRYYTQSLIVKAMSVMLMSIFMIILGFIAVTLFERNNPLFNSEAALYETVSAYTNTGLSMGMPPFLSVGGKITYVVLMYFGRLGPMTLISIFSNNMYIDVDDKHVKYVEEDIVIG